MKAKKNNIGRAGPNIDFMRRHNTSFSKNIYWDICYICKGDLVGILILILCDLCILCVLTDTEKR